MSTEDFKPLTPEQLAKMNKPYFEMEKRKKEEKLKPPAEEKTFTDEGTPPLTPEQLAEINKEYFEMEREKNKN